MQCNHRRNAAFTQPAQHSAISFQRILIPAIRRGLNAAPFHRKTVRVLSTFCGAVEVFLPAASPPIASQTRSPVRMTFLFPLPPLVVLVVAFHLMRGGGRPP